MSGYLDWQVGDRVVCVDTFGDRGHPSLRGVIWPLPGEAYTIRELQYMETSYGAGVVLWLAEINNPIVKFRGIQTPIEVGFAARHFRKVQPRKTDISIFTAMLHENKEHVPG